MRREKSLSLERRNAREEEKAAVAGEHKRLKADFKRRDRLRKDRGRKR